MGIVIREFRCGDCASTFESSDPIEEVICPHCAAEESAERVFLTPPGIKSPQTSFKDSTVKQLASDYGLTDLSNKDGKPVRQAPSGPQSPTFTNHNPQVGQVLARLGPQHADSFSPVLPVLRAAGGPRTWAKSRGH